METPSDPARRMRAVPGPDRTGDRLLIALTVVAGLASVWFYINRVTFDEPLFFIAEFLFNLPLIISLIAFVALLLTTAARFQKRRGG